MANPPYASPTRPATKRLRPFHQFGVYSPLSPNLRPNQGATIPIRQGQMETELA